MPGPHGALTLPDKAGQRVFKTLRSVFKSGSQSPGDPLLELSRLTAEVSESEKRSKVHLNRGPQSPCQPLMELLNYQKRQVNVSLKPSEVCLKSDRKEAGCTSVPTQ